MPPCKLCLYLKCFNIEKDSLNHTESQNYDNLGNLKEKVDVRNNKIVYKYDIMGRVGEVYDSTLLNSKYTGILFL